MSQLQKAVAIALSLSCVAVLAAAADRIFTTPNPAAELKRLFPGAAAFSPLAGEPLHFNAYAADPKANPSAPLLGVAFWTTDLVPQEHGYHGPIHILVGMDRSAVLTADVDAVSRASISIGSATRAIRDSARLVARQLLPEAGK